jgi:1-acyl-sn-glycerol-3-phosphate acyltransferase
MNSFIGNFRAAFRLPFFVSYTLFLYSVWFVGALFIPNKQYWREIIFGNWARMFVRIAGLRITTYGTPPSRPFFLVSNHLTYMDIPALRSVVDAVFVAKGEIAGWPLAGKIVHDMGNIYVDRRNKRDIPRAGLDVIKALDRGEGVIIFPEGTTSDGSRILPFNSSFLDFAARTDLPVYYASISYKTPVDFPPASEAICWWREEDTFLGHLWNMFQLPGFEATITIGEEPVQHTDRKQLAKELWERVRDDFTPVS